MHEHGDFAVIIIMEIPTYTVDIIIQLIFFTVKRS